jgi:hypothetical protein
MPLILQSSAQIEIHSTASHKLRPDLAGQLWIQAVGHRPYLGISVGGQRLACTLS